jgi:hypothetical protein
MKLTLMRRNELVLLLQRAADGVEKHWANEKVMINGTPWSGRALAKFLREHASAQLAAASMYDAWLQTTRTLANELRVDVIPTMFGLREWTRYTFGATSARCRELGFQPPNKRGPKPTSERRARALAKAAATRKARGTLGKQQRLAIKGVVVARR